MRKTICSFLICASIVGIVFGARLIARSEKLELPSKFVSVSSSSSAYEYPWSTNRGAEYLGGDAYNYMIEASLKAGYYAAVSTEKTLTLTGGLLLIFGSVFTLFAAIIGIQKAAENSHLISQLELIASDLNKLKERQAQDRTDSNAESMESTSRASETSESKKDAESYSEGGL